MSSIFATQVHPAPTVHMLQLALSKSAPSSTGTASRQIIQLLA